MILALVVAWMAPCCWTSSRASSHASSWAYSWAPAAPQVSVLERSPQQWPQAEFLNGESPWGEWSIGTPPPEALRPRLAQVARAYDLGDLSATLDGLFRILEVAPDFPPALHQAGLVYFKLQRYGDAIFALRRYLSAAPQRIGDTRHLAHSLYSLGRYDEALAHYEAVLAVHARSLEARLGRGLTHMRMGDLDRALKDLDAVLADNPNHPDAAFWRARVQFDMDELEGAAASLARAAKLDPFDPRPAFLQAQVLYELGEDREAEDAEGRFAELSRLTQEVRALEGRLLFNPRQAVIQRRLVNVHRTSGNWLAAGDTLRRWLRLDPENVEIRISMLELALDAGDAKSAEVVARSLRKRAQASDAARAALERYERGR